MLSEDIVGGSGGPVEWRLAHRVGGGARVSPAHAAAGPVRAAAGARPASRAVAVDAAAARRRAAPARPRARARAARSAQSRRAHIPGMIYTYLIHIQYFI